MVDVMLSTTGLVDSVRLVKVLQVSNLCHHCTVNRGSEGAEEAREERAVMLSTTGLVDSIRLVKVLQVSNLCHHCTKVRHTAIGGRAKEGRKKKDHHLDRWRGHSQPFVEASSHSKR
jgi:hypothetical protein